MWAFSDESERANRMILVVATVPPSAVHAARAHLRALLLPGQRRIHTSDESPRRRRAILDTLAHVEDVSAVALCYRRPMGVTHVDARRTLLMAATQHVVANGASSWILDNQDPQQRARDRATITGVLRGVTDTSRPVFDHRRGYSEPMLWAADALCWAVGAGGDWRRRVDTIVTVRNVEP